MQEPDDISLLRDYAENHSEAAFATLVTRHINKVYSVAYRHTHNPHRAEEITQAVFVILAKKANRLGKGVILSGWLYQTARLASVTFIRSEIRRAHREQEAHMQSILEQPAVDETWAQIAPLLDTAMARLNETDRHAIVLRFFDGKSLRDVGMALGTNEDAAKKRVSRALEKLQHFFAKRGVTSTTAIIAGVISSNSVQVAPMALAKSVTAAALAKGATVSVSTSTLVKGALKIMAWTKTKTVLVIGVGLLFAAGTATITVKQIQKAHIPDSAWRYPRINSDTVDRLPPVVKVLPTIFPGGGNFQEGADPLKCVGIGQSVPTLISAAYRWPQARMIFSDGVPQGKYDFISTLVQGDRQALQGEVKSKLGLVGRSETTNTDVLLLVLQNPNAPGLHPPKQGNYSYMGNQGYRVKIAWAHDPLSKINVFLQSASPLPIIDETGVTNRYSVDITWTEDPQDPKHTALQKVLREQLGLELVPSNMPVDMLVVEKVK